jgi:hypothetical protein
MLTPQDPGFYQQSSADRMSYYKSLSQEQSTLLPMALGTSESRQNARRAQAEVDARIDKQVADAAAKNAVDVGPYASRIAELEKLRPFQHGDNLASTERRLRMLKPEQAKWLEQQEAASRKLVYDNDPAVLNMRIHAKAFASTPPPGADPQQVALALAFANSDRFQNPLDAALEYFTVISGIEAAALEREKLKLVDTSAGASRSLAELEQQQASVRDTEQRLADAQKRLEEPHEGT